MSQMYYVILVDGIPQAVTSLSSRAKTLARELETRNRTAVIVPTYGADPDYLDEAEFISEADTEPDLNGLPL